MAGSSPVSPYYGGVGGGSFGRFTSIGGNLSSSGGGGGFSPAAALTTAGFAASAATLYRNTKDIDSIKKEIEILENQYKNISSQLVSLKKDLETSSSSLKDSKQSVQETYSPNVISRNEEDINKKTIQDAASSSKVVLSVEDVEKIVYGYVVESNKKFNQSLLGINSRIKVFESSLDELFRNFESLNLGK